MKTFAELPAYLQKVPPAQLEWLLGRLKIDADWGVNGAGEVRHQIGAQLMHELDRRSRNTSAEPPTEALPSAFDIEKLTFSEIAAGMIVLSARTRDEDVPFEIGQWLDQIFEAVLFLAVMCLQRGEAALNALDAAIKGANGPLGSVGHEIKFCTTIK